MARVTVTVWSDYVCPWCFIGQAELQRLHGELDFEVDWRPFFLRPDAPDEGWALPPHLRAKMNSPDNPLLARAASLGLTLKEREHVPSSRRAHEATEFARAHGRLDAFHHELLERYWARGEDLSDLGVLRAAAEAAQLDGAQLLIDLAAGTWRGAVQQSIEAANELGVHAVPTFIIGETFVIRGAQEGKVFRAAFDRLKTLGR